MKPVVVKPVEVNPPAPPNCSFNERDTTLLLVGVTDIGITSAASWRNEYLTRSSVTDSGIV